MTTDTQVVDIDREREQKRKAALLRAIGLDKVPPEQRELALAIANRYELDLLLKHLVLVDGRPYITRDGLLHIAHRSGQLDGIEVSDPELVTLPGVGEFWKAEATVYRKDMTRGFRYMGRYPSKGGNQRFAPEMAVKVAEVMALRRAFDVSAPVIEERWDIETQAPEEPIAPITDVIAATTRRIRSGAGGAEPSGPSVGLVHPPTAGQDEDQAAGTAPRPVDTGRDDTRMNAPEVARSTSAGEFGERARPSSAGARPSTPGRSSGSDEAGHPSDGASEPAPDTAARCMEFSPEHGRCVADFAHSGPHVDDKGETWQ
jgi:hypothetical protein